MMREGLQLLWPWAWLALPLPLLLAGLSRRARANDPGIRIPPSLAVTLSRLPRRKRLWRLPSLPALLGWLAWCLLLLALSRPVIHGDAHIQPASGRAICLVIDLSGSMERLDLDNAAGTGGAGAAGSRNRQTRLDVVKRVAGDFITARRGDRLALVLFARDAFLASPLTFDNLAVHDLLQSAGIGIAGRSTAIGDGLGLAIQALKADPAPDKAIVLLSDGTNNAGSVEPEEAAALAASLGITIHTIALGSDSASRNSLQRDPSADLDEATLNAIAAATDGAFFRARSREELDAAWRRIDAMERTDSDSPPLVLLQDLQPRILALLAGVLVLRGLWSRRLATRSVTA